MINATAVAREVLNAPELVRAEIAWELAILADKKKYSFEQILEGYKSHGGLSERVVRFRSWHNKLGTLEGTYNQARQTLQIGKVGGYA